MKLISRVEDKDAMFEKKHKHKNLSELFLFLQIKEYIYSE